MSAARSRGPEGIPYYLTYLHSNPNNFSLRLLANPFIGDLLTRMPDALPTGNHAHTLEGGDMPSSAELRVTGRCFLRICRKSGCGFRVAPRCQVAHDVACSTHVSLPS